jgi:hypothetical protein
MSKVIIVKVESCWDCNYAIGYGQDRHLCCSLADDREIRDVSEIASFCPLPDGEGY